MALLEDMADKEENENLRSLAEASLISIGLKVTSLPLPPLLILLLQVVETQLKQLDHPSWRTRLDAIRTLQHAAEPDDVEVEEGGREEECAEVEQVLVALGSKLFDESLQVRLVVIQVARRSPAPAHRLSGSAQHGQVKERRTEVASSATGGGGGVREVGVTVIRWRSSCTSLMTPMRS